MNFASDNWAGAAEPIIDALAAEARRAAPAYGRDPLSEAAAADFGRVFEREVAVFFVATGTAANALSLAALARPAGLIFCHRAAHIITDECSAPEFATGGAKLVGMQGPQAKITPAELAVALGRFPASAVRHGQPAAISISQTTEFGGVYRPQEIAAIGKVAHDAGLPLHMDGARFANAVAALGVAPADLTWRAGVDVLSFGATKNGAVAAEAIVFFDPGKAANMPFLRQRMGHLLSKGRFVAAQFRAFFADGLWLRLASHANAMASRLAAGLEKSPSARLAFPAEANEVFAFIATEAMERAREAGALFYEWPPDTLPADQQPRSGEALYRLVTSCRTEAVEVDRFLAFMR